MAPKSDSVIRQQSAEIVVTRRRFSQSELLVDFIEQQFGRIMVKPLDTLLELFIAAEKNSMYELVKLRYIVNNNNDHQDGARISCNLEKSIDMYCIVSQLCEKLYENYFPNNKTVCNITMCYVNLAVSKLREGSTPALLSQRDYWLEKMNCQAVRQWRFTDVCENILILYPNYFAVL